MHAEKNRPCPSAPDSPLPGAVRWRPASAPTAIARAVWLALAATGLGVGAASTALAQPASAPSTQPQGPRQRYDIAAGALGEALRSLASTANVLLTFTPDQTEGRTTAGLQGMFTVPEALATLLADSGLQAVQLDNGAYLLRSAPPPASRTDARPAPTLPTVLVTARAAGAAGELPKAYAGGQVASETRLGLLGNRNVFDTPFNVTGYTAQQVLNQQARDVSDVMLNNPSVRQSSDSRYGINNVFLIRGFMLFNDQSWDGLYGLVNDRRQGLSGVERVEVLNGPNALLNGVSPGQSVAGAINLVPKRAPDVPVHRLTADYVSDASFGARLDVGQRFGPANEWGIRVNASTLSGATPVDRNHARMGDIAVALDYRGDRFRIATDVVHSRQKIHASVRGYSLAPGLAIPEAPNPRRNAHQRYEYFENQDSFIATRAELDLSAQATLFAALGTAKRWEGGFGSGAIRINDAAGNSSVTLGYPEVKYHQAATVGEIGIRGSATTGPVTHRVTAAATSTRTNGESNPGYSCRFECQSQTVFSNIYNPTETPQAFATGTPDIRDKVYRYRVSGLAVADTMSLLGDRVQLTAGLRYQKFNNLDYDYYSFGEPAFGTVAERFDTSATSPAFAVVVKPTAQLSLYANHIEGLEQGANAPAGTANEFQRFPPFHTKQNEVGAKYDFGSFGVSLAAYEIKRPTTGIDDNNVFSQEGEQRNRGVELNVFGEPVRGFRLLGGAAFNHARLTQAPDGANVGRKAVGVPDTQVNLYAEYDLPWLQGLTATGRYIHTGSAPFDAANTRSISRWDRFDLGLRYAFRLSDGKPVTLRANVENVTNNNYWASAVSSRLIPGAPRTFLLSATVDF